jgi:RNA polymerase sigma-70 factor, ECF subfamily
VSSERQAAGSQLDASQRGQREKPREHRRERRNGMTESGRELLRRVFLLGYDDLKLRLTRRLGSVELASDALQDAWIRLERASSIGPVLSPRPYILRIAYNIALKRLRRERDMVTLEEAREALDFVDATPDPAKVTEARAELILLRQAAEELTPRQRDILFSVRLDGVPVREIALRHGISERLVALELKRAVLRCSQRVDRKMFQRFGPRSVEVSQKERDE